jgi:hypothetical protein
MWKSLWPFSLQAQTIWNSIPASNNQTVVAQLSLGTVEEELKQRELWPQAIGAILFSTGMSLTRKDRER